MTQVFGLSSWKDGIAIILGWRNSLVLDISNLRYLLNISMRRIGGYMSLEFRREVQAGDINLGVAIMWMVFKVMNLDGNYQKSECGKCGNKDQGLRLGK